MFITNALRDEIGELNKSKGWHDEPRSIATHCILLHSEVSEIVEDYRNPNVEITDVWYEYKNDELFGGDNEGITTSEDYKEYLGKLGKPCGIPSELADVVIRALDMAYEYEVDMNQYTYPEQYMKEMDADPIEEVFGFLHGCISKIFFADEVNFASTSTTISVCDYIANRYNINLEQQIQDKLAYNRTRPIKHGGKRL